MTQDKGPSLGTMLKEKRKSMKLGLREAAKRLGISASYLTDVEKGNRIPSDEKLQEFARELHLDIAVLRFLAKRVDKIVHEVATKDRTTAEKVPSFLRVAKNLRPDEWDKLIKMANEMTAETNE